MAEITGPVVAASCQAAGFSGEALRTIVAISYRESRWNDSVQGDIGLMDGTWGPSVGLFQIRTLRAETGRGTDRDIQALVPGATPGSQNSGQGNTPRQCQAAWNISGQGVNFTPWSTFAGLSSEALGAADNAIQGIGPGERKLAAGQYPGDTGVGGGIVGDLADAIDRGLGAVLGYDGTFSEWAGMVVLRVCEVVGGGVLIAAGAVVLIDVMFSGRASQAASSSARSAGLVSRSVRQGVSLAKKAAVVAAA